MLVFSLLTLDSIIHFEKAYAAVKPFNDIDSSYAKKEIEALVNAGVIAGYTDGTFKPGKTITRAEIAKILSAMLGLPEQPQQAAHFTDITEQSWYRGYVGALVQAGIAQGTSATKFSPDAPVTREQMVVFFMRAFDLAEKANERAWGMKWTDADQIAAWAKPSVDLASYIGFVRGIANADQSLRFEPKSNADRQAVARLAYEYLTSVNMYLGRIGSGNGENGKPETPEPEAPKPNPEENSAIPSTPGTEEPGGGNPLEEPTFTIVQNGQANAAIVIAADEDERVEAAANTLAEYVQKSTGAALPVLSAGQLPAIEMPVQIHIGTNHSQADSHLDSLLQDLDGDGFVIHPHGNNIVIAGATAWGTQFGVYEFLERYVGVRWLMPGEDGEDVPETSQLIIPQQEIRQEPAFMSRVFSPLNGENFPVQVEWAIKNRMHGRIEFHHNVHAIYPPEKFAQSHPEFYPVRNGIPQIPEPGVKVYWQPCYSEQGTVDAAIDHIVEYFNNNPEATSFSLGVNDGRGYCETEADHPAKPSKINSVGLLDMSDIYYGWVNKVVEGVLAVHPDKWFGLLAYDHVMDPPSFKLNSRVVPFITQDRLVWSDPGVEQVAKQKLEEWRTAASGIALYDYMYGNPYMVPRIYMGQMADNYKYAQSIGVTAHYAELYPNWGEGPKPWVAARLQWNPEQNVEALLGEWYERAVGEEAADDLRAYYELWDRFWTERIHASSWFQSRKNATYLEFVLPDYLNFVTAEDISTSRSLLESALAKAKTTKQKARAALLLQAFEYYEASALSYPKKVDKITDETTALSLLGEMDIEPKLALTKKRMDLLDEFSNDEVLLHFIGPPNYPNLNWTGWNADAFWELVNYQRSYEPGDGAVTQSVYAISQDMGKKSELARVMQEAVLNQFPLNGNSSFEEKSGIAPWSLWVDGPPATIMRSEEAALPGGASSLLISNLKKGGPIQTFDVKPGLMASRLHYYTPADTQTNAIIRLSLNYMDKDGKVLGNVITPARLVSSTVGKWAEVRYIGEIPTTVNDAEVKKVQMIVYINDVEQNTKLFVDDVAFFQFNEDFVSAKSIWNIYDFIVRQAPGSDAIRQRVENLAQQQADSDGRQFAQLLMSMLNALQPVNNDPSFEQGSGQGAGSTVSSWSQFGMMERVIDAANIRTGSAAISLGGTQGQRYTAQFIDFEPGPLAARVYFKLPIGAASSGTIQLSFNMLTAENEAIATMRSAGKAIIGSSDDWVACDFAFMIPDSMNEKMVQKLQFVLIVNGVPQEVPVYLDDAAVYQ